MRWRRKRSMPKLVTTWSTSVRLARSDSRAQGICRVEDTTLTGRRASSVSISTSSTDSSGNSRQSWNERTSPRPERSSGRYSTRLSPSSRTDPARGVTSPEMTSSMVVLPEPLGPMSPTMAPGSAVEPGPVHGPDPPEVDHHPLDVEPGRAGPVGMCRGVVGTRAGDVVQRAHPATCPAGAPRAGSGWGSGWP